MLVLLICFKVSAFAIKLWMPSVRNSYQQSFKTSILEASTEIHLKNSLIWLIQSSLLLKISRLNSSRKHDIHICSMVFSLLATKNKHINVIDNN